MPRYPQEKKPKLIANLGDASPFEHGGYFIYDNGDGTYTGHYWDGPDEDEPTEVFRFDIPEDVFADLSWVDLKPVASFVGSTKEKLDRAGRSGDVRTRAWAVRDAGSYHGFHNLDDYPEKYYTRDELERRYRRDYETLCRREARQRTDSQPDRQLQLDLEPDEDE